MPTEEPVSKELAVVEAKLRESKIDQASALSVRNAFTYYFDQAGKWKAQAEAIVITDASQTREMKLARESRLALRDIRVNAEKTRKRLKEESLRKGKAIDGVYNVLEFLIAPIEEHLLEQEKFVELAQEKQRSELKANREESLTPFGIDSSLYDLGRMPEETFQQLLQNTRTAKEEKDAAARKIEEERIATEKAQAEERERIRLENEKLKREAADRESKAEAERIKNAIKAAAEKRVADAKVEAEREAREKAEAELQEKKDAEAKEKADREAAEEKAAAAPDREKLLIFSAYLRQRATPDLKTKKAKTAFSRIGLKVIELAELIESEAGKL